MRDGLDGIKTYAGRVVYDRKEHKFTVKDLERIVGKSLPREIPYAGEENRVFWDTIWKIVVRLFEFLLEDPYNPWAVAILIAMAKMVDNSVGYCKGQKPFPSGFGGAGVSRPF